ncbi:MAG: GAF domain-containing protein [Acidobacteria bacterium]|nr:MAG: GAF domain-containing protein [Acidobacteriota bacterium]
MEPQRPDLRRLQWLPILATVALLAVLEYAFYALGDRLTSWQGHALLVGVVLIVAFFFNSAIFTVLSKMQDRLEQQNRELEALRSAGLDIVSELSLDVLLQKVVDQARNLIGTRYGALSVVDEKGAIETFITSGISPELRRRIGAPPTGKGLLGVVLREGQRLRLADITKDARAGGLPPHHPPMRSLLAVPVVCHGPFRGNLYLSEKHDGSDFTPLEEETLARFATQAAIAIDNAHLHRQVRDLAVAQERVRIAHEMHDGQAQVLAYVNTKAQAVREFLRAGKIDEANAQLEQLAAAAREVLADVREGILGLRTVVDADRDMASALRNHAEQWQDQVGIPVSLDMVQPLPAVDTEVALQLLRIVQESLSNVRKHARAERVRIRVDGSGGRLRIEIADDGVGFDPGARAPGKTPRFGLATMRERAEAIGARLTVRSRPGAGTRVVVEYDQSSRAPDAAPQPQRAAPVAS